MERTRQSAALLLSHAILPAPPGLAIFSTAGPLQFNSLCPGGRSLASALIATKTSPRGENLVDCWSLSHACFGESPVLEFQSAKIAVAEGQSLRNLTPAPAVSKLWKTPDAAKVLLDLVLEGKSRLVRVWAVELLRRDHAQRLRNLPVADIRRLLDHNDEEIQILGAELLENAAGLEKLTITQWRELLTVRNLTALETICRLMLQHVHSDRVDLLQAVELAVAKPAPVARLGFAFLQKRQPRTAEDLDAIARLADARAAGVGFELARWALGHVGVAGTYDVERVARFFDSLTTQVRQAALEWLAPGSAGWNDPELWSRLIETPYDDVRLRFVQLLEKRSRAAGLPSERLGHVWQTVLLGIHRGGRHKLVALRQISDAIRANPTSAEQLLPVLAVAIRSVRAPEARGGLVAVVGVLAARPELSDAIARYLPELRLEPEEVSR